MLYRAGGENENPAAVVVLEDGEPPRALIKAKALYNEA
jgi:hypothetical protein